MSVIKISELSEKTTLAGTEDLLINDSGTSKKMKTSLIKNIQTACETAQTAAETAETNAAASASAASTSESNASSSASSASTSASNASSSASSAATSATNASNSASSAASAQSAAESARDATLAAYDSFDDRYLGVKSSAPSVDNDGNALVAGALYFDSTSEKMQLWTGSAWVDAYTTGSSFLTITNNLSDLNNAATARTNLGLGSAATTASTDYVAVTGDTMTGNLDVTGTVTADGLTVDGSGTLATFGNTTANNNIGVTRTTTSPSSAYLGAYSNTGAILYTGSSGFKFTNATSNQDSLKIAYNGDISFYEDTGTTPKFFWDASAESLGIGTSSPTYNLEVNHSTSENVTIVAKGTAPAFGLYDTTASAYNWALYNSNGDLTFYNTSNTNGFNALSEKMRIDSSGNVGIGIVPETNWRTTIQAIQLGGRGAFQFDNASDSIRISNNAYTHTDTDPKYIESAGNKASEYQQYNGNHIFKTAAAGTADTLISWTETMTIDSSGNVGIGTSSIDTKLHIQVSSGDADLKLEDGSGTYMLIDQNSIGGSDVVRFKSGTSLTERMRIDSSGNVGINTSSPAGTLDVNGTLYANALMYGGAAGTDFVINNSSAGGMKYMADANGHVFQSYTSTWVTTAYMAENGDFHADGNVIAYSTTISDERLKEDVKVIESALSKVGALNGYTFKYKSDGKVSAGVIAQEVEKVLPEAVTESQLPLKTDDGEQYKLVNYDALHAVLIEAVKELTARVEQLENNNG
jgi:hypothetical protein